MHAKAIRSYIMFSFVLSHNYTVSDDSKIRPIHGKKTPLGSQTIIYCDSEGSSKWMFKTSIPQSNVSLNIDFGQLSSTIYINRVKQIHTGEYYCYGQYHESSKHFVAISRLKVYGECMQANLITMLDLL